jgi:hypothetical protein
MQAKGSTVGRWNALTAFTPIRRPWAWWLRRAFWPLFGIRPQVLDSLVGLSLIGFARWSLLDGDPRMQLPFESNFNGASDEYLEAFALVVPWGVRGTWSGAYGVPDPARVGAFQRYTRDANIEPSWYYCAYPEASTKMIRSALELRRRVRGFNARTADLDGKRFREAYDAFLAETIRIRNPARPAPAQASGMVSILLPLRDGHEDALREELEALFDDPLPVPEETTHFARFTVVPDPGPYLLASAWFDGPEEEFLDAFRARLGERAETIFRHCEHEGDPFARRLPVGAPFLGYDGATLPEIRVALAEAERFRELALRAHELPPDALSGEWRGTFP